MADEPHNQQKMKSMGLITLWQRFLYMPHRRQIFQQRFGGIKRGNENEKGVET